MQYMYTVLSFLLFSIHLCQYWLWIMKLLRAYSKLSILFYALSQIWCTSKDPVEKKLLTPL